MKLNILSMIIVGSFVFSTAAAAHDHYVINGKGDRVYLAGGNGSHNPPQQDQDGNWIICGGDPAGYGLEVAHHGPDASGHGNSDGCYMIEGGVHPGQHDGNPAID